MTLAATITVGEIAAEIPGATREFEKLGIDYCCGGSRTLGEACAAANIPFDDVVSRLENSNARNLVPPAISPGKVNSLPT